MYPPFIIIKKIITEWMTTIEWIWLLRWCPMNLIFMFLKNQLNIVVAYILGACKRSNSIEAALNALLLLHLKRFIQGAREAQFHIRFCNFAPTYLLVSLFFWHHSYLYNTQVFWRRNRKFVKFFVRWFFYLVALYTTNWAFTREYTLVTFSYAFAAINRFTHLT